MEIKVHTDFSGANLGQTEIDGNKIFTAIKDEETTSADGYSHDYAYHFAFAIENVSESEQEVELFIGCNSSDSLPDTQPNIFFSDSLEVDFQPLTSLAKTDTYKKYYFRVKLQANSTVYLANSYFRTYERQLLIFKELAAKSNVPSEVIGESIEGRQLTSYSFGTEIENIQEDNLTKPVVIITSGFHFPEQDTLATEAIFEYLSSEEGKSLSEQFDIILIPILNPDGFAHGFNGCNAAGINFHWNFDPNDKINSPEAFHIWNYLSKLLPVLFIDFHAYTFQLSRKKASPYIKPLLCYTGKSVKNLVKDLHSKIIPLTNYHSVNGDGTFLPSMLGSRLTKEFNTITLAKYHMHIADGIEESKDLAVQVFKSAVNVLISHGITKSDEILKKPYGSIEIGRFTEKIHRFSLRVLLKIYSINSLIRPGLGRMKNSVKNLF